MKKTFSLLLYLFIFSTSFSQSHEESRGIYFNIGQLEQQLASEWQESPEIIHVFLTQEEDAVSTFFGNNLKHLTDSIALKTYMGRLKSDLKPLFTVFKSRNHSIDVRPAPAEVNGPCNNIDFETGTNAGWEGHRGRACNTSPIPCNQTLGFSSTRHVITDASMIDPFIPTLSTVAPGGNHSMRIEDYASGRDIGLGNQGNASTVRQTFRVGPTNNLFTYQYAAVLEDPDDHQDAERPYFKVRMYDEAGNEIDCATYTVIAKPPLQNFSYSRVRNPNRNGNDAMMDLYYRNWTTVSIPLTAFMGQNVTVVFMASDCSRGGHLAYAYVDAKCAEIKPPQDTTICGDTPKNLSAPDGFAAYSWTGPGIIGLRNRQTISFNRPGNYVVTLTPFSDDPCPITMTYTVTQVCPTPPIKDTLCETVKGSGQTQLVNLNTYNAQAINGRAGVTIRAWYSDRVQPNNLINPATQVTVGNGAKYYAVTTFPDTVELSFLINSKPNITLPVVPPACEGSSPFQITGMLPGGGIFKGVHINNTGLFTPVAEGVHTFKYIYTNNWGCTDSSQQTVTVAKPATISTININPLCTTSSTVNISGTSSFTTSVAWSGGQGSFQNVNRLNTVYTPTQAEKNSGTPIELVLTGNAQSPCPAVKDTLILNFVIPPTAVATAIPQLCTNIDSVAITATATHAASTLWSGGSGRFKDAGLAQTFYYPSTTEKNSTNPITLTFRAAGTAPCVAAQDQTQITFLPLATITASPIGTICNTTDSVSLSATSHNTIQTLWTGGQGTFKNANAKNTYYYLSASEKNSGGTITFVIKGDAAVSCPAVADTQTLNIVRAATVTAQDLNIVCNTVDSIPLVGTAQNTTATAWSGGTGILGDASSLQTFYRPSAVEKMSTQRIFFTLTAKATAPCPEMTDTVSFRIFPQPNLNLADSPPICSTDTSIALNWTQANAQRLIWTTQGGIVKSLSPNTGQYIPTVLEKTGASIFIRAEALAYPPCLRVKDSIEVKVIPAPIVSLTPLADICANTDTITLQASTSHTSGQSWQGGHGGVFTQQDSVSTLYLLSSADKASDQLLFTFTGNAQTPCKAVVDSTTLDIAPLPKITTNALDKFCETTDSIALSISGDHLASILWQGSGNFTNANEASTVYRPTQAEKDAGIARLHVIGQATPPCGPIDDSLDILFVPQPKVNLLPIGAICADTRQIQLHSTSTNATNLQWFGGKGSFSAITPNSATYTLHSSEHSLQRLPFRVMAQAQAPCVAVQDTAWLRINPLPEGGSSTVTFCDDDDASITLDAGLATKYHWLGFTDSSRYLSVKQAQNYEVTVQNIFGCTALRNIQVLTECSPRLFISNAFSPNKDGVNDKYTVYGVHIGAFHMLIFNRWGEIIFESKDMHDVWDGDYRSEPMPIGVYEWVITYEGDSEKYRGPYKMKGSVTVVR